MAAHSHKFAIADGETVQVLLDKLLVGGSHQERREKLLEALEHKKKIEERDEVLSRAAARIMALGGSIPALEELSVKRTEREGFVAELQKAIVQIQEMGCVVKDLEMGLIDFP